MIKAHSVSLPPKSILDPSFEYRHSWNTNLKETFRRAREDRTQKDRQYIHIQIDNRSEHEKRHTIASEGRG